MALTTEDSVAPERVPAAVPQDPARESALLDGNSSPPRTGIGGQGTPYVVLAVGLLLTALATLYAAETSHTKDRVRFENLVQQTNDAITGRIENYVTLLRGVSGLIAAKPDVGREKFGDYVERLYLDRYYPGVRGIGLAVYVPEDRRDRWLADVRRSVDPSYRMWPLTPARPEYIPILHLAPLDRRNRAAIGYDMFSEPTRRETMAVARDDGRPAATRRVTLVQEIEAEKQPGFLVYVPIYSTGDVPATVEERRRRFWGFAYAPFRTGDLFEGIFGTQTAPRIGFTLYDGTDASPEHLLHRSIPGDADRSYRPSFTTTSRLTIAGRSWTVRYETRPSFERTNVNGAPFVLVAGLLMSGLSFGFSRRQVEAREVAEEAAQRLRESQAALQENEARQRHFLRDVLLSVTEGKLRLCHERAELPQKLPASEAPVALSRPSLRDLRIAAQRVAEAQKLPIARWHDLQTAVGEASMNAVVHGGGGQAQVAPLENGGVQVWIEDQGSGIDMQRLPRATLERGYTTANSLGHGFWLILHTIDRVWLLTGPEGTTVVLEQDPHCPEPGWIVGK